MLNYHLPQFPVNSAVVLYVTASQGTQSHLLGQEGLWGWSRSFHCLLGTTLTSWDTLTALWFWLPLNIFQTLCRMKLPYVTGLDILMQMQSQKGRAASPILPSLPPMCRSSDVHLAGAFDNTYTIAIYYRSHRLLVNAPGLGQATIWWTKSSCVSRFGALWDLRNEGEDELMVTLDHQSLDDWVMVADRTSKSRSPGMLRVWGWQESRPVGSFGMESFQRAFRPLFWVQKGWISLDK